MPFKQIKDSIGIRGIEIVPKRHYENLHAGQDVYCFNGVLRLLRHAEKRFKMGIDRS